MSKLSLSVESNAILTPGNDGAMDARVSISVRQAWQPGWKTTSKVGVPGQEFVSTQVWRIDCNLAWGNQSPGFRPSNSLRNFCDSTRNNAGRRAKMLRITNP